MLIFPTKPWASNPTAAPVGLKVPKIANALKDNIKQLLISCYQRKYFWALRAINGKEERTTTNLLTAKSNINNQWSAYRGTE